MARNSWENGSLWYRLQTGKVASAAKEGLIDETTALEQQTAAASAESLKLMREMISSSQAQTAIYASQLSQTLAAAKAAEDKAAAEETAAADKKRKAILALGKRRTSLISTTQTGGTIGGEVNTLRPKLLGN